jgi:hypothetical protein
MSPIHRGEIQIETERATIFAGGNDILVYNTAYAQASAKTITQGVINPTGVAFDSQGNLWVSNLWHQQWRPQRQHLRIYGRQANHRGVDH